MCYGKIWSYCFPEALQTLLFQMQGAEETTTIREKEVEKMTLEGKTVLLGVTGSIAAYKIAYLASALKKRHADVHVLMTQNATNFINPITFETLTGNKCLVDTFDRNFQFQVEHVSIAKKADVVMICSLPPSWHVNVRNSFHRP